MGMGGAFVAVADGYSAIYWNPAGLARAASVEVGGMTTNIYGIDIFFNFVAGLARWDFAAGPATPSDRGANPTAPTATDNSQQPSATPEQTTSSLRLAVGLAWTEMSTEVLAFDEYGSPLGLIRYSEALYAGAAAVWLPRLGYLGGAVKAYSYRAPQAGVGGQDALAFGLGFDLGLAAPIWEDRLWLGLAAADVGDTGVKWRNTPTEPTDRVAARYTAGLALIQRPLLLEDDGAVLAVDLSSEPLLGQTTVRAGLEYRLLFLAVRGGVVWRPGGLASFTAGAGVQALGITIDGAWVQNREVQIEGAGHTLIVSASFKF